MLSVAFMCKTASGCASQYSSASCICMLELPHLLLSLSSRTLQPRRSDLFKIIGMKQHMSMLAIGCASGADVDMLQHAVIHGDMCSRDDQSVTRTHAWNVLFNIIRTVYERSATIGIYCTVVKGDDSLTEWSRVAVKAVTVRITFVQYTFVMAQCPAHVKLQAVQPRPFETAGYMWTGKELVSMLCNIRGAWGVKGCSCCWFTGAAAQWFYVTRPAKDHCRH